MITLQFFPPYPRMAQDVRAVLREHPDGRSVRTIFTDKTYLEIAGDSIDPTADAVVARGIAAGFAERYAGSVPVFRMEFTSTEVLAAVLECRQKFHSRKVALIGPGMLLRMTEFIRNLTDIPILPYPLEQFDNDYDAIFSRLLCDGCDTALGGRVANIQGSTRGVNTLPIITSQETLWNTLNNVISTVKLYKNEQKKIETLNAFVEASNEGFILVDEKESICVCNGFAAKSLGVRKTDALGRHYRALPEALSEKVRAVFAHGARYNNELVNINDNMFTVSVTRIPLNPDSNGVFVNFTSVSAIQNIEQKIRTDLHLRGMKAKYAFKDIVYQSEKMETCIDTALKYSLVDSNILLHGETGVGKEILAQSIHAASPRRNEAFVAVNCAALPDQLLESELFGYTEGSFTGASKKGKPGLFELAHNGTLFLDEIAEIPLSFQSKLLRVLQEKEIRRIGADRVVPVNVRLIAATNRDLQTMVVEGHFREDLYFRLDVLSILIPPLRERPEDIPPLFEHFLAAYRQRFGKGACRITPEALDMLRAHQWSGNIRELQNVAERLSVLADDDRIDAALLRQAGLARALAQYKAFKTWQEEERERIREVLAQARSKDEAAARLSMSRTTLWRKIKHYNLEGFTSVCNKHET